MISEPGIRQEKKYLVVKLKEPWPPKLIKNPGGILIKKKKKVEIRNLGSFFLKASPDPFYNGD